MIRALALCRKREADAPALPEAGLAKRPSKTAEREDEAESGNLKDLLAEEDLASAPKRKSSVVKQPEPKPPPYQQVHAGSRPRAAIALPTL